MLSLERLCRELDEASTARPVLLIADKPLR
jgi:hypothetical protein